ncbi:MAG: Rpn family recombination-promoting nuclease/putative transposase [Spirochaetaceae bacterium]
MYFLDVKTDFAFKKVFGSVENKRILISFLNSIVDFPNNRQIKDLEIVDPYNIPMLQGMKDSFVDVKAVLDDNSKVIIEMQVLNHQGFEKRILYNAAKNYSIQLKRKDEYTLLNPVIALTIVDFEMFPESIEVINRFKLLEKESFISYSDDIELIFIELPKFTNQLDDLEDIKDQWIYFLKNAGSLEYVPTNFDPTVIQALDSVNEAGLTEDELEIQHKRKEYNYIQKSSVEQGIEKGLKQGREQEKELIALELLKENLPVELIAKTTKLTVQEVKSIKVSKNK